MNLRQLIILLVLAVLIIYSVIDYNKNNFDVTGFVFICNQDICEIRHRKADGQIKYTDKIDISKIENFSAELEKVPRTNSSGMVIYANCKDGTRFRLSPIYVKPSEYLDTELLIPLNIKIKKSPVSINISFPY